MTEPKLEDVSIKLNILDEDAIKGLNLAQSQPVQVEKVACAKCLFFKPEQNTCLKNPPTVVMVTAPLPAPLEGSLSDDLLKKVQWVCIWPTVRPTDWCGAWLKR